MFERRYPAGASSGPWMISRQPCAMEIAFCILSLGSARETTRGWAAYDADWAAVSTQSYCVHLVESYDGRADAARPVVDVAGSVQGFAAVISRWSIEPEYTEHTEWTTICPWFGPIWNRLQRRSRARSNLSSAREYLTESR